ncbi:MAG TPA: hypothetical protein VGK39_07735 [Cyclobacteriaceae bacterium]
MKDKQNHVIRKIRRLSVAVDKGESWTWVLLAGLLALMTVAAVYYLVM